MPTLPKVPAVEKSAAGPSLDLPPEPEVKVGEGAALPNEVMPAKKAKPVPKSAAESIAPSVPRQPKVVTPEHIEVIALRAGFYDRERHNEGDEFFVDKFEDLGSWMEPKDPVIAAKHRQAMEAKRKARLAPKMKKHLLDDAE